MGKYKIDNRTGKMILLFNKQEYLDLPSDIKGDVKRYFNFSKYQSGWISKGQADTYMPKSIAEKLNFKFAGNIGEKQSFTEKMEARGLNKDGAENSDGN